VKRSLLTLQVAHSEELEALQKLLHFPEEVALRLADTEYHLFYQVPPIDYLRQVTLDLGGSTSDVPTPASGPGSVDHPHQPTTESATSASASAARPSVRSLIKRFNEVKYFMYHV
jgi:phosphatidylinositol phospholipase C epsilon